MAAAPLGIPSPKLRRALAKAADEIPLPAAIVDLDAVHANADLLRARAHGRPLRVATKSVRVREILDEALGRPGFAGLMAYSLPEALWLASCGYDDILVAYPSVDRAALRALAADPVAARRITIMADDPAHLRLAADAWATSGGNADAPIALCLDVDASLRIGRLHLGARRSPLRTPHAVARLARAVAKAPGLSLAGLMFYDAQIAGLPDTSAAVRTVKRASDRELRGRRRAVVATVARELAAAGAPPLRLVNGGGSGSLDITGADDALTELAAGSGLFAPTSFDGYHGWSPTPALFLALPVVRRPAPGFVTAFAGGYVASGRAGPSRLPTPVWPPGLHLLGAEGVGEVQTPLRLPRGRRARRWGAVADADEAPLTIGDAAWFRPTKAGEPLERFDRVWLVERGRPPRPVPTYRGEGRCFG